MILAILLSLSLPPDFDKPTFCAIATAIYEEAGRDERRAAMIAKARGYSAQRIWLAKRICRPQ